MVKKNMHPVKINIW